MIRLGDFAAEEGFCWTCALPLDAPSGDGLSGELSTLRVFEDGREIGPAHSPHRDIRELGGGRFSHWGGVLYLSSSDNRSPLSPGRNYMALVEEPSREERVRLLQSAASLTPALLDEEEKYRWGERLFSAFVKDVKLSEYGRSFFHDASFKTDYERFERENYRSFDRKFALKEFAKMAFRRAGDVAECGVFRGASAYLLAKEIRCVASGKVLHLFDSFRGLSKPGAVDGGYWKAGALACSLDEVATNLQSFADEIIFHEGWIPTRFGEVADRRFCFVHIDLDLFQPTWDTLTFFYPRMTPGGLMICDDYGFDTCRGARKAVDEFFEGRTEAPVHLPTGQGVIFVEDQGLLLAEDEEKLQ